MNKVNNASDPLNDIFLIKIIKKVKKMTSINCESKTIHSDGGTRTQSKIGRQKDNE